MTWHEWGSIEEQIARMRSRLRMGPRKEVRLQSEPEHKLILSGKQGSNGKILNVRCKCMAEYANIRDSYYMYDLLGEASSIKQAAAIYKAHLENSGNNDRDNLLQ